MRITDGRLLKDAKTGDAYMFRDVFDGAGKLLRCEYATIIPNSLMNQVRWTECAEGSHFSEVRPLLPKGWAA